ncbi:LlaJI family restriction endonuclease, partial [Gottfriedia acidiceleris]
YNNTYDIYTIEILDLLEFIKSNYYILWGKIMLIQENKAVLVLEKGEKDSLKIKEIIKFNKNIIIKQIKFK